MKIKYCAVCNEYTLKLKHCNTITIDRGDKYKKIRGYEI